MNKRLINELDVYINYDQYLNSNNYIYKKMAYDVLELEKNIYHIEHHRFNILNIGIKVNNKAYRIKLDFKNLYYPWVPPLIILCYKQNDINFKYFLKNSWDSFKILFNYSTIKDFKLSSGCLCCESDLYKKKWSPTMNIFTIIKRIIKDINNIDKFKNIFIFEKVNKKYHIHNSNLITQYLYKKN